MKEDKTIASEKKINSPNISEIPHLNVNKPIEIKDDNLEDPNCKNTDFFRVKSFIEKHITPDHILNRRYEHQNGPMQLSEYEHKNKSKKENK
ncbi:hypothetical protein CWI37_1518p0010 [Hamiltosporidium tvaerminnensis]|uniref:Uncharacterized protein n=1 Tax=Hamiltosporidium tvaerminnensis TaxID=1176355 RepID=A0A4Q9KX51_9MICR|nr:hypothetical protein CWI37_1518p0010 [Hamiltosporidium tvaerminnensis]